MIFLSLHFLLWAAFSSQTHYSCERQLFFVGPAFRFSDGADLELAKVHFAPRDFEGHSTACHNHMQHLTSLSMWILSYLGSHLWTWFLYQFQGDSPSWAMTNYRGPSFRRTQSFCQWVEAPNFGTSARQDGLAWMHLMWTWSRARGSKVCTLHLGSYATCASHLAGHRDYHQVACASGAPLAAPFTVRVADDVPFTIYS